MFGPPISLVVFKMKDGIARALGTGGPDKAPHEIRNKLFEAISAAMQLVTSAPHTYFGSNSAADLSRRYSGTVSRRNVDRSVNPRRDSG
jgi:hypothetical protein